MGNSELSPWGETWFATAAAWGGVDRGRHQRERHLAQTLQKGRVSATKMFTGFGGVWWKQLIFSVIRRLGTASSDVPRTIWKRCSVDECGQFLFKNGWYKMVHAIVLGRCWNPDSHGARQDSASPRWRSQADPHLHARCERHCTDSGTVGGCLQGWNKWLFTLMVLIVLIVFDGFGFRTFWIRSWFGGTRDIQRLSLRYSPFW